MKYNGSPIALGTWPMSGDGRYGKIDDAGATEAIHVALDRGITTFDTAPGYGGGHAEELLGRMKTIAPMGMVFHHLLCSEVDAALDWLEKALEQHDALLLTYVQTDLLEPLRMSPRWRALARRINLPEASRSPRP